eukprot:jgi/Botrbrau1/19707/Bobra.0003s0068.1
MMRKELHLPQSLKMQLVAVSEFVFQISIHLVQVFAPAGRQWERFQRQTGCQPGLWRWAERHSRILGPIRLIYAAASYTTVGYAPAFRITFWPDVPSLRVGASLGELKLVQW